MVFVVNGGAIVVTTLFTTVITALLVTALLVTTVIVNVVAYGSCLVKRSFGRIGLLEQ